MYKYLALLVIVSAIGFQGWRTLFNNYAVDVVGVNAVQIGAIQSVREIPGFFTFFVVYFLLIIAEHRFAALSVLLLGIGVVFTGLLPSFGGLMFTTLLMSVGFHFFETNNQSLTLQYFTDERVPIVLAKMKSFIALANVSVGVLIWLLSKYLPIHYLFFFIGVITILGAVYAFTKNPVDKLLPAQKKKLVFKRKYWLFYLLNFLSGARRQIFVVFAVFILVEKYHFSVMYIAILFIINNIITFFLSPYVGKAINRFGERALLTVEYASLIVVFLGYAFVESREMVTFFYLIDNLFFSFAIAINSYFRKNAEPADIAPSMSVGFAINHITAVILPVIGGILWTYNWRIPFLGGAFLSVCSLVFARFVKAPPTQLKHS